MKKTKFVFISLEERNGEREYTHNMVREIPASVKDEWDWADKQQAAQFYGGEPEATEDGYYFNGGEVCVSVKGTRVITEAEYKVLSRFL